MNNIYFYDKNYKSYIENTYSLDLSTHYKTFETIIPKKSHILDLGCGSGRDSKYFSDKGFRVTSLDGSIEMVKFCNTILTNRVIHSTFEDFRTEEKFDGIWACASLLHVKRDNLKQIVQKYIEMLNSSGIFFISFKLYEEDFQFKQRSFTCFTLKSLKTFISTLDNVSTILMRESDSVQASSMKWVSVILKKA